MDGPKYRGFILKIMPIGSQPNEWVSVPRDLQWANLHPKVAKKVDAPPKDGTCGMSEVFKELFILNYKCNGPQDVERSSPNRFHVCLKGHKSVKTLERYNSKVTHVKLQGKHVRQARVSR